MIITFPKLEIIEHIDTNYVRVKLDWSDFDKHIINRELNNMFSYRIKLDQKDKDTLKRFSEKYDHSKYLYPIEYKYIYDLFDGVKIPKRYYNEIIYMKDQAIMEFNRNRVFDTIVREECLEVSFKYVYLYFYLLTDGLFIYSDEHNQIIENFEFNKSEIISFLLFRFWLNQTGRGLVVDKSTEHIKNELKKNIMIDILKKYTNEHLFGIKFNNNFIYDEIKKIIKQALISEREEKIKNII
ncbi:MAG: hypothetical protein M0R46_12780 [Candidatus Muirbacterium halophilum]|nr:hypothetical protein [Candidatus Muirbacterium halophilum]